VITKCGWWVKGSAFHRQSSPTELHHHPPVEHFQECIYKQTSASVLTSVSQSQRSGDRPGLGSELWGKGRRSHMARLGAVSIEVDSCLTSIKPTSPQNTLFLIMLSISKRSWRCKVLICFWLTQHGQGPGQYGRSLAFEASSPWTTGSRTWSLVSRFGSSKRLSQKSYYCLPRG
jgi:hypothetical protein